MRVAVYAPYAMKCPHFETDLEIVQNHVDAGDDVTILNCEGELEACDVNLLHHKSRCQKCIGRMRHGLSLLPETVRRERIYRLTAEDERQLAELKTEFTTQREAEEYFLGEFDIGYAGLSSLISKLREPNLTFDRKQSRLYRSLLRTAFIAYASMKRYLQANPTDRVYLFNGRFAALRGALRACQELGVDCYTHERGHTTNHYVMVKNTTLHDYIYMETEFRTIWAKAPIDKREEIAGHWYKIRKDGTNRDSFVGQQSRGQLPENWDSNRHNIAIYISSEDEYVGLGDAWKNPLYKSQTAGIQQIVNTFDAREHNVHFYLRVHPNLALVRNQQTREIAALNSPCLTVIPPTDEVDTYALMDAADSVLTFGSATGIEAVYWQRPSILAGISFYRNLGGTYNPETHEELVELLQQKLKPKPIEPAMIFSYYWSTYGQPYNHYQADSFLTGKFKGVQITPSFSDKAKSVLLEIANPSRTLQSLSKSVVKGYRKLENRLRKAG